MFFPLYAIPSFVPIFAICLGHQLMALATGGDTYKMKYGHRGGNHPVKDLTTGRVYISSQNLGIYYVAKIGRAHRQRRSLEIIQTESCSAMALETRKNVLLLLKK